MVSVCSQYRVKTAKSKAALAQGYRGIIIDQWLPPDRLKLKDRAWLLGPMEIIETENVDRKWSITYIYGGNSHPSRQVDSSFT